MTSYINTVRDSAVDACMPAARLGVFMAIARSANSSTGIAWPSQETIGERVQLSVRSVRTHIKQLTEDGWIILVRKGKGGDGRSGVPNTYKLVVPEIRPDAPERPTQRKRAAVVPMARRQPPSPPVISPGESGFNIEEAMDAHEEF